MVRVWLIYVIPNIIVFGLVEHFGGCCFIWVDVCGGFIGWVMFDTSCWVYCFINADVILAALCSSVGIA